MDTNRGTFLIFLTNKPSSVERGHAFVLIVLFRYTPDLLSHKGLCAGRRGGPLFLLSNQAPAYIPRVNPETQSGLFRKFPIRVFASKSHTHHRKLPRATGKAHRSAFPWKAPLSLQAYRPFFSSSKIELVPRRAPLCACYSIRYPPSNRLEQAVALPMIRYFQVEHISITILGLSTDSDD